MCCQSVQHHHCKRTLAPSAPNPPPPVSIFFTAPPKYRFSRCRTLYRHPSCTPSRVRLRCVAIRRGRVRGLCGGWIFFVGWVGYLSFVCRCSHPVSQMKAEYRSVDTLSSAPEHKPSVLSRISSSLLPSMRKSTLRSGLINKIRTSDDGSREKCIACNQLLQYDLKQNEDNICGEYFTNVAEDDDTYYGQYVNLLRNVREFSRSNPGAGGGHTRKRNRRSRIPRRTHVRRTRQRKSKRNNYR